MHVRKECNDITLQRAYYARTASQYDSRHVDPHDGHHLALSILSGLIDQTEAASVLDVGSGTGRAVRYLKLRHPGVRIVGIEPVDELRTVGHRNGLGLDELIEGDATALQAADDSYDIVAEFGALHHILDSERAVREMVRVARHGVFLSDSNNFGHGMPLTRIAKQMLNALRLWPLADYIKTRGKRYTLSEGDGLAYSYSVFNSEAFLRQKFPNVLFFGLSASSGNLYRTASHVGVFAHR
ncbi:class I SAM-dependent methyltransferase [Azospirillum sp. Sh1]|uniref:class I SAM-dependent methyltransferase n=1 Tax=Azospirillum sp. Sh1 TaxID=2607285 RepID=UPI0011EDB543|nr:class I SAM-dependent methyltransferase [Azospirillum sp. Sh1]KAA0570267.1 class I SAM-dependent methyltransferase [Azospirillum sp. Sh1]